MTVQSPAILDVRARHANASKVAAWLRGIGVRRVRIACGLVMFAYIFSHFFNHALGSVSYPAMKQLGSMRPAWSEPGEAANTLWPVFRSTNVP